ncbi:GRAM domain-containing protein 2B isoform X1 [Patella vulgata]|uniref:GRAM domain-containing protein 2B isoform X1 n=1 Tax=Patella vulgata TaxID=6465 RepID=UPI0021805D03|nr:GRAM domain-containing protein 2B isoform X1 [Patella vulgata]
MPKREIIASGSDLKENGNQDSPKLERKTPTVRFKAKELLRAIGIYSATRQTDANNLTDRSFKHVNKPIQTTRSVAVKKVNWRDDDNMRLRRVNSERFTHRIKPENVPENIPQPRKSLPTLSTISTSSGDKSPVVGEKNGFLDPNPNQVITTSLSAKTDDDIQTTPSPTMISKKSNGNGIDYLYPPVSKSRNEQFHKLFRSVPDDEFPIDYFSCAFKGDILLQGYLYISPNWICFYSKIKGRGRQLEIPFTDVICMTREKTALVFPNAIGIQTADSKIVFVSFMSRDSTYRLLENLWKLSQSSGDVKSKSSSLKRKIEFESSVQRALIESSSIGDTTSDSDLNILFDTCKCVNIENCSKEKRDKSCVICKSKKSMDQPPSKLARVPFLYMIKCFDRHELTNAFCNFKFRLQKIPRTNLLLAICSILVFFLLVSAVGLTYKVLVIQAKIDLEQSWKPHFKQRFRDHMMGEAFNVEMESHASTIKHLHSVIKANIQLLEEVHDSLKSLQSGVGKNTCNVKECP